MPNEQIEVLRERLNNMMASDSVSKEELLRASEELDVLIVGSMKEQQKNSNAFPKQIANELDALMDKLQIFKKLYHAIRIVDPIKKNVYEVTNGELIDTGATCFDLWNRNSICDNCVSMRAIKENDSIFKLEIKEGRIHLITAVPFTINEKRFAVEMLKDVSNSMFISSGFEYEWEQILSAIEYMNKK